jgi:hypothetical protein
MSVGAAVSSDQANNILTSNAKAVQVSMQNVVKLWSWVVKLGADQAAQQAALVTLGFSSADAATFWTKANNLFSVAQVYYGQGTQGSVFNYDDALAGIRGPA